MNWKKNLFLSLFALILVLLDISFFSAISLNGATIISTYILIINFALLTNPKDYHNNFTFFEVTSLIGFSVFSSVPITILFFAFFIVPAIIVFLRKNYFPMPSILNSVVFFFLSNIIFEFLFVLYQKQINQTGIELIAYFSIINTLFGVFVYYISNRIKPRNLEIKI